MSRSRCPGGITIAIAAIVALVPLTLAVYGLRLDFVTAELGVFVYVLGVAFLGLIDDLTGSAPDRRR